MSNDDDVLRQQGPASGLSRRDALRKLGLFGAAAVVAPAVLAACGGDDDDDAGGGGGGATTTAAGGGGTGGDVGTQLADAARHRPRRQERQGRGLRPRQRAGPHRQRLVLRPDHDAEAPIWPSSTWPRPVDRTSRSATRTTSRAIRRPGVTAINELGAEKVPAKLASYVDDLGAMFAGTEQFKIFTLDGGGGTSSFGQGLPYFWGTRAITPNDAVPGLLMYLKETSPDAEDRRPERLGRGRAQQHPDQGGHPQDHRRRRLRVQRPVTSCSR